MGSLVGHVAPGFAFLFLGFWHLLNHTKLHCQTPNSYFAHPWFPTSRFRYLELALTMVAGSISVAMELFIGPRAHHPFAPDGSIPSNHLHNFEHSSISMTIIVYALFAIILDKAKAKARFELTQLLAAIAFGQELFLFHLHSTDHTGVEGQFHLLLQMVIVVSLSTSLLGIKYPRSFIANFVRSSSVMFQGVWFITMGYMLWTPSLVSKGCFLHLEEGHQVVRCSSQEALHRAKSLVNIQFSWFLIGFTIFLMVFYLFCDKMFDREVDYFSLTEVDIDDHDQDQQSFDGSDDVEAQKFKKSITFMHIGKGFPSLDIEK